MDFNKFDSERWAEDEFRLDLFCVFCSGIERNAIGGTLKDYFISLGIVRDALDYIIVCTLFVYEVSNDFCMFYQ